jgi:hypothetical protein
MERAYPAFEEMVQAVGELIAEGKVRHWGLSNESTFGEPLVCPVARLWLAGSGLAAAAAA